MLVILVPALVEALSGELASSFLPLSTLRTTLRSLRQRSNVFFNGDEEQAGRGQPPVSTAE
jgi:hypothetical protein